MIEWIMRRAVLALTLLAASLLVSRRAESFCRTTTCSNCPLDQNGCTIGGTPISWPQACVSFSVQKDGSRIADYGLALQLARSAFNSWQAAQCGTGGDSPSISMVDQFGPVLCNKHEYNVGRGNANAIIFHDDVWPYPDDVQNTLALTTVTFDKNTGNIHDADLEINATQPLSTATPVPTDSFDLRSILVHETGHFLGLAHSTDPASVMRPSYIPGDDSFRRLAADDEAGICDIYRPDFPTGPCDFTPRYGFSPDCAIRVSSGEGCVLSSRARAGTPSQPAFGDGALWSSLVALALARVAVNRRIRRRRPA
jgi:hypothetical protein